MKTEKMTVEPAPPAGGSIRDGAALTVTVSLDHIQNGEIGEPMLCPIALALNEEFPSVGGWVVSYARAAKWEQGMGPVHFPLPPDAIAFVRSFDIGLPVEPFTFVLESLARSLCSQAARSEEQASECIQHGGSS